MQSTLSVVQIIDLFLSEQSICQQSRRTYRASLMYFFSYITSSNTWNPYRNTEVRLISTAMICDFKDNLNTKHLSQCSTRLYISVVKRFFLWTARKGLHENVAYDVKNIKPYKGLAKDFLSLEQSTLLIKSIDQSTTIGKRNYAIVCLLLFNGLRSVEVVRINNQNLIDENGVPSLFVQGKGKINPDEKIPIPEITYNAIKEYQLTKPESKPNEPLFLSYSHRNPNVRISTRSITKFIFNQLTATGLKTDRISTHSLRHTSANLALMNGIELPELRAFLRHSSYTITELYVSQLQQKSIYNNKVSALLSDMVINGMK